MTLRVILERELVSRGIGWCHGGCNMDPRYDRRNKFGGAHVHTWGFVRGKTIHLDRLIGTEASLRRGMHLIGHIVLEHRDRTGNERKEREANSWVQERLLREPSVSDVVPSLQCHGVRNGSMRKSQ